MTINEMLDEVQRISTKLHGVGCGLQYREHRPGEHTITLYRSRYKDGNNNLHKEEGTSYDDVVTKLHGKLVEREKQHDAMNRAVNEQPRILATSGTHAQEEIKPRLSDREVPGERYCYSSDGELWEGEEPSELAAFIAGCLALDVKTLWVAERVDVNVIGMVPGVALAVEAIEQLQEQAVEQAGEAAEDWLAGLHATDESVQELSKGLTAVVVGWLQKNKKMPKFFGVSGARVRATSEMGKHE